MTEEDAIRSICPITCQNCLGERCMMWREKREMQYGYSGEGAERIRTGKQVVTGGYCGLAGQE